MSISGVFNNHSHHFFLEVVDFSEIVDFIERKARFFDCYFEGLFCGASSPRLNYIKFGDYIKSSAKNKLDPAYTPSMENTHRTVLERLVEADCPLDLNKQLESGNAAVDGAMCFGMSLHFIKEIIDHYDDKDFETIISRKSKKFKEGGDAKDLAVTQIQRQRDYSTPYDYIVRAAQCFYDLDLNECQRKNPFAYFSDVDLEGFLEDVTKFAPQMKIHGIQKRVEELGNGIYLIDEAPEKGTEYGHAIVFVKKGDLNVIFDPNVGAMKVPSAEVGTVLDALLKYTSQSGMTFYRASKNYNKE